MSIPLPFPNINDTVSNDVQTWSSAKILDYLKPALETEVTEVIDTLTGNIINFNNTDNYFISNITADIPYDANNSFLSLTVVHTKTNQYTSGVEIGNISAYGENTDNLNPNRARSINKIPVKANTEYTVGQKENYQCGIFYYKADGTFISYIGWDDTPRTFTTPALTAFVRFAYQISTNVLPTELQLQEGATLDTYEAPESQTINIGSTVYGGTFDISGGTGKAYDSDGVLQDITFTPAADIIMFIGINNIWVDQFGTIQADIMSSDTIGNILKKEGIL